MIPLQARCGTQRMGRGIALLFHDRGTRRRWVVSSTPRPHFTPGKDWVPIVQEAGWAPGPVWTGGKSRPHRDSIPYRPSRSQSLYRLSYWVRPFRTTTKNLNTWYSKMKRCNAILWMDRSSKLEPLTEPFDHLKDNNCALTLWPLTTTILVVPHR